MLWRKVEQGMRIEDIGREDTILDETEKFSVSKYMKELREWSMKLSAEEVF